MNPETIDLARDFGAYLDAQIQALGPAAKYGYDILVKQAFITGIRTCIIGALILIVPLFLNKARKNIDAHKKEWYDDAEGLIAVLYAFTIITTIVGVIVMGYGATRIANPEYYAIEKAAQMINPQKSN